MDSNLWRSTPRKSSTTLADTALTRSATWQTRRCRCGLLSTEQKLLHLLNLLESCEHLGLQRNHRQEGREASSLSLPPSLLLTELLPYLTFRSSRAPSVSEQKGVKAAAGDVMQCFGTCCESLIMFGFLSCRPNNLDRLGKLEGPMFSSSGVCLRTTRTMSKRHLTRQTFRSSLIPNEMTCKRLLRLILWRCFPKNQNRSTSLPTKSSTRSG
mmetsp:Transcript_12730/g.44598  ORF Transcript_12730/g.44598 Transcript_12730/m.44598 type:complete len:212 (-) Transcript_12730:1201-1836(-)